VSETAIEPHLTATIFTIMIPETAQQHTRRRAVDSTTSEGFFVYNPNPERNFSPEIKQEKWKVSSTTGGEEASYVR
jgi:hypothetical protein